MGLSKKEYNLTALEYGLYTDKSYNTSTVLLMNLYLVKGREEAQGEKVNRRSTAC